jgi:hypothetical protein
MIHMTNTTPTKTNRSVVRLLPVALSADERAQRSLRLAERLSRRRDVQHEKRTAVEIAGRELRDLELEIDALTEIVASGHEIREVRCTERRDLDRRVLEVVRLDTDDIVDSRPLVEAELQVELPLDVDVPDPAPVIPMGPRPRRKT